MVVDAQVGYTFQSGALEGLGILLQASNLTNEPFVTYYNNDPRQIRDYQNYGRNFMAGITFKFWQNRRAGRHVRPHGCGPTVLWRQTRRASRQERLRTFVLFSVIHESSNKKKDTHTNTNTIT